MRRATTERENGGRSESSCGFRTDGGGERRNERGSSSQRMFKSETTKMKGPVGWKNALFIFF